VDTPRPWPRTNRTRRVPPTQGGGEREEEEDDEDDFSFLGQQRGARAREELRRAAEADAAAGVTPPVAAGAVRGKMEFPDISTIDPYDPQVRTNDTAPASKRHSPPGRAAAADIPPLPHLARSRAPPPPALVLPLPVSLPYSRLARRGADPRPARAQTFGYTLVGAVLGAHGVPPRPRAPSVNSRTFIHFRPSPSALNRRVPTTQHPPPVLFLPPPPPPPPPAGSRLTSRRCAKSSHPRSARGARRSMTPERPPPSPVQSGHVSSIPPY